MVPGRIDVSIEDVRLWSASAEHASFGDVDGDGKLDVLAAGDDIVLFHDVLAEAPVETEFCCSRTSAWILPDLNGDGKDEVAVGHRTENLMRFWSDFAPGAESPEPVAVVSGWRQNREPLEVYTVPGWGLGVGALMPGNSGWGYAWFSELPAGELSRNDLPSARFELADPTGPAIHPIIGDLDGDGAEDLSHHDRGLTGSSCPDPAESGLVVHQGPVADGERHTSGPELARLCFPVNLHEYWDMITGDWNGDGVRDLAVGVGAASDERGQVAVYWGPVAGALTLDGADALITGENAGTSLGRLIQNGGDLDGDGVDDLVIGAERDLQAEPEGLIYVFTAAQLDGPTSVVEGAAARILRPNVRTLALHAIYPVGDRDGDGLGDLLLLWNETVTFVSSPFRAAE